MKLNKTNIKTAKDMLAQLNGDHPYNRPDNICYGDGYFRKSIEKKFGMPIDELEKAIMKYDLSGENNDCL